jgi:hypothetical protein
MRMNRPAVRRRRRPERPAMKAITTVVPSSGHAELGDLRGP